MKTAQFRISRIWFWRRSGRAGANAKPPIAASARRLPFAVLNRVSLALAGGCFLLGPLGASGQNYAINWHQVAGGGGTSTGGVYSVKSTIGQHDASGPMTGGAYSLTGGFWALFAIQIPGAPSLRIFLTHTNTAVISWPSPSTGFNLQQNASLTTTNWGTPPQTVNDDGINRFIIVSPPTGKEFYRLSKP